MRSTPMLLWLYLLNAAVLITHEIDSAYWHEWVLVAGGLFAVIIHTYFLLQGGAAFRLPASLALLVTTFLLSLAQAATLLRARSAARGKKAI